MTIRLLLTTICCITTFLLSGCASTGKAPEKEEDSLSLKEESYVLRGRNYSFAIYNNEHRLLTHPIEDLLSEMKWRKVTGGKKITDIYIVSHGWNYTQSTAIANYHNYIAMIDEHMKKERTDEEKENKRSFQPYFIFVTWTSSVRPLTNLAKGVLPFGIDSAVEPITTLIDKVPLHLFTGWKESLNATHNALGTRYPNYYFLNKQMHEDKQTYRYRDGSLVLDGDNIMGVPVSLSALIYRLIELKASPIIKDDEDCKTLISDRFDPESDKCVSLIDTKLHTVGHSYGAKLVTMASMEALRRWMLEGIESNCVKDDKNVIKNCGNYDDLNLSGDSENIVYLKDLTREKLATSPYTGHVQPAGDLGLFKKTEPHLLNKFYKETREMPIESLVLFNPAFHPGELSYPVGGIMWSAPTETLKFIPRKAIVFTTHDYANGALFGLSGAILNTQINQWYQQMMSDLEQKSFTRTKDWNEFAKMAYTPVLAAGEASGGLISLAYSLVYTQIGQAFYSVNNIPRDFWHHVKTGTLDGWFSDEPTSDLSPKSIGRGMVNAIDFFLPIKLTRMLSPDEKKRGLPFFHLRDEADQGLYRISRPGLGKTGLNNLAKGRWPGLNLAGLSSYYLPRCKPIEESDDCINTQQTDDDSKTPFAPNIDADAFYKFSESAPTLYNKGEPDFLKDDLLWQREKFYSFDASQVYNSKTPLVGAHSDLREVKKREHTFNFVLRFTQTDFNKKLKEIKNELKDKELKK